ncbi:MAG: VWA domain-containing protein [Spirochaetales bacterium]|jgi:Ca-activated chloride channel homolog|nr:VWA domain-containing protein [Spirochaetales bacterium]
MKKFTMVVITVIVVVVVAAIAFRARRGGEEGEEWEPDGNSVFVVHWTNGHLLRTGSGLRLLTQMAEEFNKDRRKTDSGKRIKVEVVYYGSWEQAVDLLARATGKSPVDKDRPNPTIVTPSAAHWLIPVNHQAGRKVVDPGSARSIARAMIGIVTYKEMAECLGWPEKELGYADIIALRNDPEGWARYPSAKAEWGRRPLVAFTDPTTSSTGRSVLFSLYAIAADKSPEDLTVDDVKNPEVIAYVKNFQNLIDHYMISTRPLLTKIYQGTRFGHFFLMPEDNLIHLYEGTESIFINGEKVIPPPLEKEMVMIYPKEGTMARNNSACIVDAAWVTEEHVEGATEWVDFLREDEQQRSFMIAGFRPGTDMAPTHPISKVYGLDPKEPPLVYRPEKVDPEVAAAIDGAWVEVKRPGIVTFIIDQSGSMIGEKLQQAKDGMIAALDTMAQNNQVGFIAFGDTISVRIPVRPLAQNRFDIAEAVCEMRAGGQTALYDAVSAGIRMTDNASGNENAIRGVVVLTDGQANVGSVRLDEIVRMMSRDETPIRSYSGLRRDRPRDENGLKVSKSDTVGTGLVIETRYPVQIFFIGIGGDADLDIGRLLSEASGAEFQGAAAKDLAEVLEEYSKYF